MFKKGHEHKGGRPKGKKPRRNLTDDNTTGKHHSSKARGANKNGIVDKFPITKKWDTSSRYKQLDPELVDYYIYNDLDVTELFEGLKNYRESEDERDNENM
jgi:arylsulfatase A-like enzyme